MDFPCSSAHSRSRNRSAAERPSLSTLDATRTSYFRSRAGSVNQGPRPGRSKGETPPDTLRSSEVATTSLSGPSRPDGRRLVVAVNP